MKNKLLITFIMILSFGVGGCSNSQIESNYSNFKESYILTTDFVDKDNDYLEALKKVDMNILEAEIKKMKEFMDEMNINTNSNEEQGIYNNVKLWYEQVEFLYHAAKDVDELTTEEKRRVYTECTSAKLTRSEMKKGEV